MGAGVYRCVSVCKNLCAHVSDRVALLFCVWDCV